MAVIPPVKFNKLVIKFDTDYTLSFPAGNVSSGLGFLNAAPAFTPVACASLCLPFPPNNCSSCSGCIPASFLSSSILEGSISSPSKILLIILLALNLSLKAFARIGFLNVESIIVFGHTQCGGIQALFDQNIDNRLKRKPYHFIAKWMDIARSAYDNVIAEHSHASVKEQRMLCEKYALINSLRNLKSFPWIQRRIDKGTLSIHAWYLDLATGVVHRYDQQSNVWLSV